MRRCQPKGEIIDKKAEVGVMELQSRLFQREPGLQVGRVLWQSGDKGLISSSSTDLLNDPGQSLNTPEPRFPHL